MNAIDTNVLVYAIDSHEPAKQVKARNLLSQQNALSDTVLLWQVAGEYLSCLFSEDLDAGMAYESVRVVNPFA